MNELVLVFAGEQVALHLRAELLLHSLHCAYDLADSLLRGLKSTWLLLVGAATRELGRSLFQFVHTAHLHGVKLGGTRVFLVAADPVVQVDSLLHLHRLRGRTVFLSGAWLDHHMINGDLFGHMVFVEVDEVLARVLLEPIVEAVNELVVFTAGVGTGEFFVVLKQTSDLVLLLEFDVLFTLLNELVGHEAAGDLELHGHVHSWLLSH